MANAQMTSDDIQSPLCAARGGERLVLPRAAGTGTIDRTKSLKKRTKLLLCLGSLSAFQEPTQKVRDLMTAQRRRASEALLPAVRFAPPQCTKGAVTASAMAGASRRASAVVAALRSQLPAPRLARVLRGYVIQVGGDAARSQRTICLGSASQPVPTARRFLA
jgi:hypothetical protein